MATTVIICTPVSDATPARAMKPTAEVTTTNIDEDVDGKLSVLGPDRSRAARQFDRRHFGKPHRAAGAPHLLLPRYRSWIASQCARIADGGAVALASFDGRGDHLGPQRHRGDILHVADREPVAVEWHAVWHDV